MQGVWAEMKINKKDRQSIILDIINTEEISTQEELVIALKDKGLNVTQATVSRDIKELNIVKANTSSGTQIFVAMKTVDDPNTDRLLKVFSEAIVSSSTTDCLIILKTLPGMAPACASAVDAMHLRQIAGTLAGDDTIFVAVSSGADIARVERDLMQFSNGRSK